MPGENDHIAQILGTQAPLSDQEIDELDGGQGSLDDEIPGGEPSVDEPPAATDEPPAPTGRRNQKVPLAALTEERTRRQELQDQLKSRDEQYQRLEQRTNILLQQFSQQQQVAQQASQQQQQPAQIPSFTEDPEGHVTALRQQFEQQLQALQQQNQVYQQVAQQDVQRQQMASFAAQAEEQFKAVQPDYTNAANFFAERKMREYAALGLDPVTAQRQLAVDYSGLVQGSIQTNRNPAQVLYALATAMGYTPGQQQAPAGKVAAKPAAQQVPKQAPTSLASVEGVRTPGEEGELSVESLANMTDAEFDRLFAKMGRGSKQRPTF